MRSRMRSADEMDGPRRGRRRLDRNSRKIGIRVKDGGQRNGGQARDESAREKREGKRYTFPFSSCHLS